MERVCNIPERNISDKKNAEIEDGVFEKQFTLYQRREATLHMFHNIILALFRWPPSLFCQLIDPKLKIKTNLENQIDMH